MVSVIIPNYNHSIFLTQRIESVLNQSYTNFELIILDDKSSDNSREIIERYKDNEHVSHIIFNEQNSGSTFKQWDLGFSLAKGEYIWIAESDDYAEPTLLQRCVEQLDANPETSICYCDSNIVDSNGEPIADSWLLPLIEATDESCKIKYSGEEFIREKLLQNNYIYNASMALFRKEAIYSLDNKYKEFKCCGDWLFWIFIAQQGSVIRVPERLNNFRQHPNKVSIGKNQLTSISESIFIKSVTALNLCKDYNRAAILKESLNPQTFLYDEGINTFIDVFMHSKTSRRFKLFMMLCLYRHKRRSFYSDEDYLKYKTTVKNTIADKVKMVSVMCFLMKNSKTLHRYMQSKLY
ncbi:MAG: glycosyltransferase [Rikenellaceae bacterium]